MIIELLIFFFTMPQMSLVLFAPALAVAFFAGIISFAKGVRR
jgi:hypothetical protein